MGPGFSPGALPVHGREGMDTMRQHGRGAAAVAAAFVAFASVMVAATNVATAATPTAGLVNAVMAPGSSTSKDGSYYALTLQPGATATQQILVRNNSGSAV